jgi:formylglycine-generating enzyme required for sulfatase activity
MPGPDRVIAPREWDEGYQASEQPDPRGPGEGQYRVARGGSWIYHARCARVSNRIYREPANRTYFIGLRCAGEVH